MSKNITPGNEPFVFYSRSHLIELTGIKARNIQELLKNIRTVGGSCIYHHTHHFIQQHQYLSPEPANDFAYWVSESLGDKGLGEALASIDIMSHPTIRSIREALIDTIEKAIEKSPRLKNLSSPEAQPFSFLRSLSFVFPTGHTAKDLQEFSAGLKAISLDSIYFHMFEARLRLERPTNDFSNWLLNSLGEKQLALKIARLDPYTNTGEGLKTKILELTEKRIQEMRGADVPA